ncbi:multicilin [Echeneis naucrates]|uniref:multicilin n=1 Tax=Echeneis naucrates TaxID=173247 RepID=UPI001113FD4F|nr:multicilin [Echeneis naucrates]
METCKPGECRLYQLRIKSGPFSFAAERTEMQRGRKAFAGGVCLNQTAHRGRRATDKALLPRSSSPLTVYVELPCIGEQGLRILDVTSECHALLELNEPDADDQEFGDYALDFMAESPTTLESSLSQDELVPFQGCVIPPLTPQRDFSSEDSAINSSTEAGNPPAQDGALWEGIAQCRVWGLDHSLEVNHQLHETLHRRQKEIDNLQERNLHLRQLASRAKHLASVLEKLMTVRNPAANEVVPPCSDKTSWSPCKRQRLDEGYETESSDSVEDMLRDISTRCNAVLHGATTAPTTQQQQSDTIQMFGTFSGLQTSVSKVGIVKTDGAETDESISSFRTIIREHCNIRTQVFPHGRAFTTKTQEGGYRFRWVPNHS